jgi:transcriptional regulator with XRE-family HTH domain
VPEKKEPTQLGGRLRSLRISLGLTQEQLAERANLHYSYIGQVERGEKTPSLRTLKRLAEAMHTRVEYLVGETPTYEDQTGDLRRELLALLSDCPPQELQLIMDMIRVLVFHLRDRRGLLSGPDEG